MSLNIATKPTLLTMGHSDHEISAFISLIKHHGVSAVADVRSHPYGRFHTQFNRETLADSLKRSKIDYVFLGRELGARRVERESYRNGKARYDLICRLPAFIEGLDRLRRGIVSHRIAILCAERDPVTCHRTILVCRQLRSEPFDIRHILEDGSLETNEQAESRLLEMAGVPSTHLFCDHSELIEQAYDIQADRIAFVEPDSATVASGGAS